jgi:hypothetical protein
LGGKTLEWAVPNPIPLANFELLPVVIADPYGYGEGDPELSHTREQREAVVGVGAGSSEPAPTRGEGD